MAEVKWIKITTTMFDDEKIRVIEGMPDADAILVIWIKLLTLAGKNNANGFIFLAENIPYTDETLSTIFNRPLNTVRLALQLFKQFKMIEYDADGYLQLTNWGKHQNLEGLDKIREQTRARVAKHRETKKLLPPVISNVTVTLSNATDLDKNKNKKRIDKDKELTLFEIAINDFKDFRKGIKSPMTDRAVELLRLNLNKFTDDDETKIAILNQSIMNGWKSVYALKDDKPKKGPTLDAASEKQKELIRSLYIGNEAGKEV